MNDPWNRYCAFGAYPEEDFANGKASRVALRVEHGADDAMSCYQSRTAVSHVYKFASYTPSRSH